VNSLGFATNPTGFSQGETELASVIVGLVAVMAIGLIGGVTAVLSRRTLLRFISLHDVVDPAH
jgi:hypothetical protein